MAVIYRAIQDRKELTEAQINLSSAELKKLYKSRGSIRIRADGIMGIRVASHNKVRLCIICRPKSRQTVMWQICVNSFWHESYIELDKLTWYWPSMTVEFRQIICSCEVYQAAKHGGNKISK